MEWKFPITGRQIWVPGKISRYGYQATGWKTEKKMVGSFPAEERNSSFR